jgi:hypothetical protein
MGLSFTFAGDLRQRSHSQVRVPRQPPTWRVRSPYLYPPGIGWPSYNPRHWVPFSSPPTTRRATVEVFDPASTMNYCTNCIVSGGSIENTSVTQQWIYANHIENISCDTGSIVAFTAPSHSNGSCPIFAYIFVAAGMCLPRRCLEMCLYVTILKWN